MEGGNDNFKFNCNKTSQCKLSLASSSSSSSEEKAEFEYDVFLSFRGADTRNTFTGNLYAAMKERGIHAFVDHEELNKGENINHLLQYIEKSKILIPIFSKGYAESKWCLKEVTKMVDCVGRLIIPIFFDVEPSHVRNQTGPYEDAFKSHKNGKEVKRWRNALRRVGDLAGYDLQTETNGHEANLIRIIIKGILQELKRTVFDGAEHPVGVDDRVGDVLNLIDVGCNDVRMVVIHGIGGIGKTTLAKEIFNRISRSFEFSCFLSNVREASKQVDGLVSLQKSLIEEVSKDKNPQVCNVSHGKVRIKEFLYRKNALLVLDDVDNREQVLALAGSEEWFGSKSKIIVTTRYEHILTNEKKWKMKEKYPVKELNEKESLDLFSYYAFVEAEPPEKYMKLSQEVVATTHGIPLILQVFGSLFFDRKNPLEWKDTLKELKEHQHKEVHERLRISYEGLPDEAKQIFLDIAFFFIGEDKEEAFCIWEDCRFIPHTSVQILLRRSLIKINNGNRFEMHDQIRDMGREIVRQEATFDPSKRSRVFRHEDALLVVRNTHEGIVENVQGIRVHTYWRLGNSDAFVKMPNLRLLIGFCFNEPDDDSDNLMHFPSSLKWLDLHQYLVGCQPSIKNLTELVVLKLYFGAFHELPVTKRFDKLKVLVICGCKKLIAIPQFTYMPSIVKLVLAGCSGLCKLDASIGCLVNLVLLNLNGCSSLEEIPSTIGNLTSLKDLELGHTSIKGLPNSMMHLSNLTHLSLEECIKLKKLPRSIGCLKKLQTLNLRGCQSLKEVPCCIGDLKSLETFILTRSRVKSIPSSIGCLEQLSRFDLDGCSLLEKVPDTLGSLKNLCQLSFSNCQSLTKIPDSMGGLKAIRQLTLGAPLTTLPDSIRELDNMKNLALCNCDKLIFIPQLPSTLISLMAFDCGALISISDISNLRMLQILHLEGCKLPLDIPGLENLISIRSLCLKNIGDISNHVMKRLSKAYYKDLECMSLMRYWDLNQDRVWFFGLPKVMNNCNMKCVFPLYKQRRQRRAPPPNMRLQVLEGDDSSSVFEIEHLKMMKQDDFFGSYETSIGEDDVMQRQLRDGGKMMKVSTNINDFKWIMIDLSVSRKS